MAAGGADRSSGGTSASLEANATGEAAGLDLDGRFSLESARWGVALRGVTEGVGAGARDGEPASRSLSGFVELCWPSGVRWIAGDLAARWAAGCALADDDAFASWAERIPAAGEPLLHARGTLARRDPARRGGLAQGRLRCLAWAAWWLSDAAGGSLALGPLGAACLRAPAGESRPWRWSLVFRPAGGSASEGGGEREGLLLEAAGRAGGASGEIGAAGGRDLWLAGRWSVGPLPEIGSAQAAFRWRAHERMRALAGAADEEWELVWGLPWLRGMAPRLAWFARQMPAPARPAALALRALELRIGLEPWNGASLRFTLGTTRTEQQSSAQQAGSGRSPITTAAARFALEAKVCLAAHLDLAIRTRHRGWSAESSADQKTAWSAPREASEDPAGDGVAPWPSSALLQDEETCDQTWVQLDWKGTARWGGWALAIVPRENDAASYLPVRVAPGRTQWRAFARGGWMLQAWLGGTLAGSARRRALSLEVVLRAHGGRDAAPSLELCAGLRGHCP